MLFLPLPYIPQIIKTTPGLILLFPEIGFPSRIPIPILHNQPDIIHNVRIILLILDYLPETPNNDITRDHLHNMLLVLHHL